ncbi:MAG: PLDc N-terminal domain-containing protein [Planctomycetota bacterium]
MGFDPFGFTGILGLIILILDIIAIVGIVRSKLEMPIKLLWLLVVIFLPILGMILWFAVGRKTG